MTLFGILLGLIGRDIYTGQLRFTFGSVDLVDGVSFVTIAVGIFAVGEVMRQLTGAGLGEPTTQRFSRLLLTREQFRRIVGPVLRGTGIGSLLGLLPGGGAVLSSFVSYSVEKRVSKNPSEFGHGAIEGVAGPEAANNAGAQTSFIPMLTLGIPSNPVMALMIGALVIQGITPGPKVITGEPAMFWGLIASMWLGNLMLVVLNLPLVGLWARLVSVPYTILMPVILGISTIGVFSIGLSSFDVLMMAGIGMLGFILVKLDCEPAPLLLGFILGPMLEEHLRRAMIVSRGEFSTFITHPISAVLLVLSVISLVLALRPANKKRREEIFADDA